MEARAMSAVMLSRLRWDPDPRTCLAPMRRTPRGLAIRSMLLPTSSRGSRNRNPNRVAPGRSNHPHPSWPGPAKRTDTGQGAGSDTGRSAWGRQPRGGPQCELPLSRSSCANGGRGGCCSELPRERRAQRCAPSADSIKLGCSRVQIPRLGLAPTQHARSISTTASGHGRRSRVASTCSALMRSPGCAALPWPRGTPPLGPEVSSGPSWTTPAPQTCARSPHSVATRGADRPRAPKDGIGPFRER